MVPYDGESAGHCPESCHFYCMEELEEVTAEECQESCLNSDSCFAVEYQDQERICDHCSKHCEGELYIFDKESLHWWCYERVFSDFVSSSKNLFYYDGF